MTSALRERAAAHRSHGIPTAIVEVVATRGSVPREVGTRMLVWRDGTDGTIGGGRLEWQAIAVARAALDGGRWPGDHEVVLGASLGQCCGGAVTLAYRRLDDAALAAWPSAPGVTLQVYGAGHVGRAIVRIVETLGWRVQWIDERSDAFPAAASSPNIERICVDAVEAEVPTAPPDCDYLVVTHQHDLDLAIVEAILRRGDFGYLGLIGSATKRRRFAQLLGARGCHDGAIARITCPIGLPQIEGKEPATIAVAVVAQLLARR